MDIEIPAQGVTYLKQPLAEIWTGVTIIEGAERLLIVDTATAAAVDETILPYLKAAGLPGQREVLIVNTHCHCDHIGGNAALKTQFDARIAAHEDDSAFIANRSMQFDALFGGYAASEFAMNREGFMALAGEDAPVDRILRDGDVLEQFQVHHAPGHSAGSIVLFDASTGLLLAGDAPQCAGTTDTELPLLTDIPAYRRTLDMLLELDAATLVLDHAFKPYDTAIMHGEAVRDYLLECQGQLGFFQAFADEIISAHPAGLTVRQLAVKLAEAAGLSAPNVYACMLANAFLEAAENLEPIDLRAAIPDQHYKPK